LLGFRLSGKAQALLYPEAEGSRVLYRSDSRYSHIEVRDALRSGRRERILIEDALIHNRYDPSAPDDLLYQYEQIFAVLTRRAVAAGDGPFAFRTLTLGAGGCVFPLYLERNYPDSENVVVDIDPEVLEVAGRYFDLSEDSAIVQVAADARNYVASVQGAERFDVVYLDAFNSYSIPAHLTTVEFTRQVAALLSPGGILMANCIDILEEGRFLNAYLNTLAVVFPHAAVYVNSGFSADRRATFVILAASSPLGEEQLLLDEHGGETPGVRLEARLLADLKTRNGEGILTDDYAPVENLMAPVFLRSVE
jgi:spermidine synthase